MFLENESELCECGLTSFRRIRLRQLVWSFTPIAIFYENFLSVKYRRFSRSCKEFSPKSEKKKKNAESTGLENGVVSQKPEGTWLFM